MGGQESAAQAEVQAGLVMTFCISLSIGLAVCALFSLFRSSCPFLSPKRKAANDAATTVAEQISSFDISRQSILVCHTTSIVMAYEISQQICHLLSSFSTRPGPGGSVRCGLCSYGPSRTGWIGALWRMPDLSDELFHATGIDTMLYLHFLRQV